MANPLPLPPKTFGQQDAGILYTCKAGRAKLVYDVVDKSDDERYG
jgi:hypothetical protein|tara:strand:- start:366 stop:500 length:135 start_codon:yes stop_codon:yes gene_type:complete